MRSGLADVEGKKNKIKFIKYQKFKSECSDDPNDLYKRIKYCFNTIPDWGRQNKIYNCYHYYKITNSVHY